MNRDSRISNNVTAEIQTNKSIHLATVFPEKSFKSVINQFNDKSNEHHNFITPPSYSESPKDINLVKTPFCIKSKIFSKQFSEKYHEQNHKWKMLINLMLMSMLVKLTNNLNLNFEALIHYALYTKVLALERKWI